MVVENSLKWNDDSVIFTENYKAVVACEVRHRFEMVCSLISYHDCS